VVAALAVSACWVPWGSQLLPSLVEKEDRPAAVATQLPGAAVQSPQESLHDYAFLLERVVEEHHWSRERAAGAIVEYLRFLTLLAEAPRMELVASSDVDLVWHEHLIDTENYVRDTRRLFGHFIHHRRARTLAEFADIPTSYARTKEVYASRYGELPPATFWGPETTAASMCGGGNKGLDPSPPSSSPAAPSPPSPGGATPAPPAGDTSAAARRGTKVLVALLASAFAGSAALAQSGAL